MVESSSPRVLPDHSTCLGLSGEQEKDRISQDSTPGWNSSHESWEVVCSYLKLCSWSTWMPTNPHPDLQPKPGDVFHYSKVIQGFCQVSGDVLSFYRWNQTCRNRNKSLIPLGTQSLGWIPHCWPWDFLTLLLFHCSWWGEKKGSVLSWQHLGEVFLLDFWRKTRKSFAAPPNIENFTWGKCIFGVKWCGKLI